MISRFFNFFNSLFLSISNGIFSNYKSIATRFYQGTTLSQMYSRMLHSYVTLGGNISVFSCIVDNYEVAKYDCIKVQVLIIIYSF